MMKLIVASRGCRYISKCSQLARIFDNFEQGVGDAACSPVRSHSVLACFLQPRVSRVFHDEHRHQVG